MNATEKHLGARESRVDSEDSVRHSYPAILMVDDQPARLLTYESILTGLPIQCIRALSGNEALQQLLKREFAVILLDVSMPEMDGFELARLIREHPRMERTPIIFITGVHVSELDQLRGYEVGAIDYIAVPVVPEILRSKIALLVELYQRREELKKLNAELAQARNQVHTEPGPARSPAKSEAAELFRSEAERFRAITETIPQLVWSARPDGYSDYYNQRFLDYLGLDREQMQGDAWAATIHPDDRGRALAAWQRAVGGMATYSIEFRIRRGADGEYRWHLVRGEPLRDSGGQIVRWFGTCTDIHDAKRSEQALAKSERLHRTLLQYAPVGVVHAALDGRIQYTNGAISNLLGYSAEELVGKTWQEITHPDDLSADESLAKRVLAGELPHYTLQKRYIRKNGSFVWIELFGSFAFDESAAPLFRVGIVIDIHERLQAENSLRESQDRLVLAKTAARLGTFDWNIQTDSLVWDERTHELWGIESSVPMNVAAFFSGIHPDDQASVKQAIDASFEYRGNHAYSALYRVIHRLDGVTRWVEATGHVHFDNDHPVRMVGVVREVTDRVVARQKLADSERRFRELANHIGQIVWTCDELGHPTWYNHRWFEYTGLSPETPSVNDWETVVHPDHRGRIHASMVKALRSGGPWEDTFQLRDPHGNYRWFLGRAVPIRGEAGKVLRWFGTSTDITDQRKLQEALEQADRRKDEFLAMLAHELRNPVAPVSNAAEALSRMISGVPSAKPLVQIIQRQALHLSRLLDDLLDVARVTQGRIELQKASVTVAACIEMALETAGDLIRRKGHKVILTEPRERLLVDADPVRLAQCFGNVLINAAKYTPPGGDIHIRPFEEHGWAVVEIIDSGMGIAPELLPHIFDLFVQADRSLDRSEGGLGIGLAVCRRLIEMQGGNIRAASAGSGRGSTFTIRLPLIEAAAVSQESRQVLELTAAVRVLVVDDNQDAADSLAMLLNIEGYETLCVYSGAAAIEAFGTFEPDVIVLDIGLPGMNGYEVARELRSRPSGDRVKIIAVTGYGQPEDRERALQSGFDTHLIKPISPAGLSTVLASCRPQTRADD